MVAGHAAKMNAEAGGRPDPLDHWLAQERAGRFEDHLQPDPVEASDGQLPSGWWILPLGLLSFSAWGALVWRLFAA